MTVIAGILTQLPADGRHPERLPKMRQVFGDDPVPTTAGSLAGQEGA
ncbi:MAG TPA: hypothetical protein VMI33_26500 [Streptosporangiaceae bacterium]|nr:hypothetical protein [Streptosporangiaceae bacterium]